MAPAPARARPLSRSLLLVLHFLVVGLGLSIASPDDKVARLGFRGTEEELMKAFEQLSSGDNPPEIIFLDMDVETTADFLNLTQGMKLNFGGNGDEDVGEATVAQFLDVPGAIGSSSDSDITLEKIQNCDPESSVFGVLSRRANTLANYDFSLTTNALESTGISSLLDTMPEDDDEFKAYVLIAPTDNAWVKLKQRLTEEPSLEAENLPLQSLLTYQIYGETNQTLFNAVKDVINGTFFDEAPFSFFLNVPIDMLDGNATVLSTGNAMDGTPPELNSQPILAIEPACNGIVLALDDILVPGIAVKDFMRDPEERKDDDDARKASSSFSGSGSSSSRGGRGDGCTDVPPPSPLGTDWTCEDQRYWGKCHTRWMWSSRYCEETCGYCGKSEFPYASAAESRDSGDESEGGSAEEFVDPCACTRDGLSGGVFTGVSGCSTMTVSQLMGMAYASSVSGASDAAIGIGREFGSEFDGIVPGTPEFNYCYVVDPKECRAYTEPSPFYEGVRWRFC